MVMLHVYMPLPSNMLIPANVQVNRCVTISALSNVFLASENHQSGALIWESSKHHGIGCFFLHDSKPMVWGFHGLQGTRHIHHPWHTLWLCWWPFCAMPFLNCDTWLDTPKTFSLIDAPQGDHPRWPFTGWNSTFRVIEIYMVFSCIFWCPSPSLCHVVTLCLLYQFVPTSREFGLLHNSQNLHSWGGNWGTGCQVQSKDSGVVVVRRAVWGGFGKRIWRYEERWLSFPRMES